MFKRPFYFLTLLLCVVLIAGGIFLSLVLQPKAASENLVQVSPKVPAVQKVEVLNASYSAITLISGSIKSQKSTTGATVTSKGNNLLVLINKSIRLSEAFAPADLISINGLVLTSKGELLRKEAADHLVEMFAASSAAGYELSVTSAYRSYAKQVATFNAWVAVAGLTAASQFSARPGHSQHQLGTAVDLSATRIKDNLTTGFGKIPEGVWLASNSWKYGYVLSYPAGKEAITGYSYEPWHFRYIGVAAATQLHNLGWDLETYLQKYGVW